MAAPRALVKRDTGPVALERLLASEKQLEADLAKTRRVIGTTLREMREERGLNLDETRALTGVTQTIVSLLERGLRWNREAALRLSATLAALPRAAAGRRE